MKETIIVRPDKCVGCNACVKSCPAPEANVTRLMSDGRVIMSVNANKCIGCGECIRACPRGARDYLDDTEECMSRVTKEKCVIIVHPSIKTALPTQWKGVLDWFKQNGSYIYDISYGMDICLWAHLRAIDHKTVGNFVTQTCPSVVRYAEVYQPKLLKNLSPIQSPLSCQVIYIKNYLRRSNPVGVLSPCISMRIEAEETKLIDFNVTFKKMMEYFDRNDIRIPQNAADDYEYEYNDIQGMGTDLYPCIKDIGEMVSEQYNEQLCSSSDGVARIYEELDAYGNISEAKQPNIFDVNSCKYGCSLGPGIVSDRQTSFDIMSMKRTIQQEIDIRPRTVAYRGGYQKLFKSFDNELQLSDFTRRYASLPPQPLPSAAQLGKVYEKMGKNSDDDKKINCGLCGYRTCRELAIAVSRGQCVPESCLYARLGGGGSSDDSELRDANDRLNEIISQCRELTDKLNNDIGGISGGVGAIGESAAKTGERANNVKLLLESITAFCSGNDTMDSDSVKQLVGVLQTTVSAFSAVDETINAANEQSDAVRNEITRITELIGSLNSVLNAENQ